MERLAGIDAQFLYMETPAAHMHTMKIAVVEPAPGVNYSIDRVRQDLRERMHLLAPFRRRLVEVPLGLHHPVWIDDPAFDLDHHVRRITAPPPGGPREMDAMVSRIASTPLDRTRPLWELWSVDGLAGGRIAAVCKIHHAVADGIATARLLASVLAPGGHDLSPEVAGAPWRPETPPSRGRLVRDALRERARQMRELPALARHTAGGLRAATAARRAVTPRPPRPVLDTPRSAFNGALTSRRAFASTAVDLDDMRRVKAAFGVTLNDVLLALVAGALRDRLAARGALPARPLTAEVPVATDPPDSARQAGNRLSNIFTSLCTDEPDPVARLRRISQVTRAAKALHEAMGPDLYEAWTQYSMAGPLQWWMRLYSRLRLADRHPPAVNCIVSTVPGPRERLSWPTGRLEAIYSVGPIIEGAALNVTAWSYAGRMCCGVLSCPDLLADPHDVATRFQTALDELLAAAPASPDRVAAGVV